MHAFSASYWPDHFSNRSIQYIILNIFIMYVIFIIDLTYIMDYISDIYILYMYL